MAKIRLLIANLMNTVVVAFLEAGKLFSRVFILIRHRRWLSDPMVLTLGALIGLAAGLYFFRVFIFTPGLGAMYFDLSWPTSQDAYPMHYLWWEITQTAQPPQYMLAYLFVCWLPPEIGVRFLFLVIFMVMGMSMFFAMYKLTAPRHATSRVPLIASTVATVFFIANPIVVLYWEHPYSILWFYAFLPLLTYCSYSAFSSVLSLKLSGMVKKSIIVALIMFLMSFSSLLPFYLPFIVLAFLAGMSRPYSDYLKRSTVLIALILLIFTVLSSVWLLPTVFGAGAVPWHVVPTESQVSELSRYNTWSDIVTLRRPISWTTLPHYWHISASLLPYYNAATLMLPVLAACALIFRRSKLVVWLAIFAVAFLFLVRGLLPPSGGLYHWLMWEAPGSSLYGWQFRTPSKWIMLVAGCYFILIGLATSYFLGWLKSKKRWVWLIRGIFVITIVILLAIPPISGYPLLTGDLSHNLRKRQLNEETVKYFEWLEADGTDRKLVNYPRTDKMLQPKPAQGRSYYVGEHFPLGFRIMYNSLTKTTRLGKLFSPWNVGYVTFTSYLYSSYDDIGLTASLSAMAGQEDMELVYNSTSIYVYEYKAGTREIEASTHSAVVVGGLENMLSLIMVDSYDPVCCPVIFLDQSPPTSEYTRNSDIVITNQANLDLYLSMLDGKYILAPFPYVEKSSEGCVKGSGEDIFGAPWHSLLESSQVRLFNWQHDYGKNYVSSSMGAWMDIPFEVDRTGYYDILVRHFRNLWGAATTVLIDGELVGQVSAQGMQNEFEWREVGGVNLEKGGHTLRYEQRVKGSNTVNMFAVLPSGALERYENEMDNIIQGKRIISIWEAETALNYSESAEISEEYGVNASNGNVRMLLADSRVWRGIEVPRDGNYQVAVRLDGNAQVGVDSQFHPVSSVGLEFSYLDPLYLEKGSYTIEVRPSGSEPCAVDVVWLYSTEDEGEAVEDIFNFEQSNAEVVSYQKVDPTKYIARVNASEPFMLEFAETYNQLWEASVNGKKYQNVRINSLVNGFWVDETGELEITVEYRAQRYFYYGAIVSGVGILGCLTFLIWNWRGRKKTRGG